jgi:hypothetical protein
MNLNKSIVALTFAALLLAVVSTTAGIRNTHIAGDQIVASFEREFNHVPVAAAAATRDAIGEDELYVLINEPLQTGSTNNLGAN